MIPIFDLHSDLLGCVEHDEKRNNFNSPALNCSVPQIVEGGVKLQVLAIAAIGGEDGAKKGERQLELYDDLLKSQSGIITKFGDASGIQTLFAIENASAVCDEEDPIEKAFERIKKCKEKAPVVYTSLTWNGENRFGGGNVTNVGLKRDGELLIDFLAEEGISIDFSHTSRALADDILNYIQKKNLDIVPMASHSNYASVFDVPRNLSDDVAKEIGRMRGVIGINFVHRFVGKTSESFRDHVEHALKLGLEDSIAFGSDFYGGWDDDELVKITGHSSAFYDEFSDASTLQHFLSFIEEVASVEQIEKIAYKNVQQYLGVKFGK